MLELEDGTRLTESGAILFYLASGTRFLPEEPLARAQVLRWLIFEQTDAMPAVGGLRFRLQTGRLAPDDPDALARRSDGEEILDLLDRQLGEHDFLTGPAYTIADIAIYGYVHVAPEAGYELSARPALDRWLDRVRAQPRHLADLAPYPENARPGAGRSTYGP